MLSMTLVVPLFLAGTVLAEIIISLQASSVKSASALNMLLSLPVLGLMLLQSTGFVLFSSESMLWILIILVGGNAALFILGLVAYRSNWLARLSEATGRLWLGIGIFMILLFWPLALAGDMATSLAPFLGGWHWQALAYALWESFLCLGMCIGLIYAFRRYCHGHGRLARFLSHNAYAAYLVHGPLITIMALAARDLVLHPLAKFGLVSLVAVPLCFGLSSLIRKLPYADRVL